MQVRKRYTLLTLTILAIFAIFVIWPGFVIDRYVQLQAYLREPAQVIATPPTVLSEIDFDVPTATSTVEVSSDLAAEDHLIIPSIGVNGEVIISKDQSALDRGFWHIPGSALPGTPGNIVISSHRWLHVPPHPVTFYRIDEVKIGDPIYYNYAGKRYTYKVTEMKIVEPTEVSILSQEEDKLTLFTCHPLFSTAQRYVVIAKLSSVDDIVLAE